MSLAGADIAFATELFSDIPDLTTRRMFGGLGLYSNGVIFALMRSDTRILIKAQDAGFEQELASRGAEKWTYTRKSGTVSSMPYWVLPQEDVENRDAATALARQALSLLRS